jgi:hypothetical protein
VTFIALAFGRAWLQQSDVAAELVVMTGIPMVLFTFYMITDPQTSPSRVRSQIFLGAGIAFAYSVLLMLHVQYTMFYSVTIACALRGLGLAVIALRARFPSPVTSAVPVRSSSPGPMHSKVYNQSE